MARDSLVKVALALITVATVVPLTTGVGSWSGFSSSVYILRLKGKSTHQWASSIELRGGEHSRFEDTRKYAEYLRQTHDTFLIEALEPGSYEKLYSYTFVLNAVAVKLLRSVIQVEMLRSHPSVLFVEEERLFKKSTTHTPDFLGLPTGAWKLDGGPDHAGENVVIGMIDTGIDPSHPSFASEITSDGSTPATWKGKCVVADSFPIGSCNSKVVGAQYFDRGIIAANLFNESYDFASPMDGDGHGTHTSSIAAGNAGVPVFVSGYNYGNASGVAPRAGLAIYKVIYRDGGILSDVLAGIDQAVQDRVDVLSISLGSTSGTYGVPSLNTFDIALLFAVKAGVVVLHAAGNNGPYPLSMNSFGPWVISVASGTTDRTYPNHVILGDGQRFGGAGFSAGTPNKQFYPLIHAKDAFANSSVGYDSEYFSYCQDPSPFKVSLVRQKILICNFVEYYSGGAAAQFQAALHTAHNLNVAGLVVLTESSDTTLEKTNMFDPIPFSIPTSFVTDINDAKLILQYYKENIKDKGGRMKEFRAMARLQDSRRACFDTEAPEVSAFSARGPIYSDTVTSVIADVLKPDIVAPGSQIWGAWTPSATDSIGYNGENFAVLSGTSMATPHVAGVAALIKQKHPAWTVSAIQSAILTTATQEDSRRRPLFAQQPSSNSSIMRGQGTHFDFGFGAINPTRALDPGLVFEKDFQDYINFLCTLPGADENTVQDATGGTCHTHLGSRSSDLNVPSITVANLLGSRTAERTITNVGPEETYVANIVHPMGVNVTVKPDTFTIRENHSIKFEVTLTVTTSVRHFTFGSLTWKGSSGHVVLMPLSMSPNSVST